MEDSPKEQHNPLPLSVTLSRTTSPSWSQVVPSHILIPSVCEVCHRLYLARQLRSHQVVVATIKLTADRPASFSDGNCWGDVSVLFSPIAARHLLADSQFLWGQYWYLLAWQTSCLLSINESQLTNLCVSRRDSVLWWNNGPGQWPL